MYQIFGDKRSGNCYKVQLVCRMLNVTYQWFDLDMTDKANLPAEFFVISPQQTVPIMRLPNGTVIEESNAIMCYLGHGSPLVPSKKLYFMQMLQWMFYEQSTFQPPINLIRQIKMLENMPAKRLQAYHDGLITAQNNFVYLDKYFAKHSFLVADKFSLADVSVFAYAQLAYGGGLDVDNYPNVIAWMHRIQTQAGFVPM